MAISTIPVIDVDESNEAEASRQLHAALRDIGFAYIVNHGIAIHKIQNILDFSRSFFALPDAIKQQIHMDKAGLAWRGFFPVGAEFTSKLPDQKEGIYFGVDHDSQHPGVLNSWPMHGINQWPASPELTGFRSVIGEYINSLTTLGHRLMALIAAGLGLKTDYFKERFTEDPHVLFRIFNYPQQAIPQSNWGVGQHTDMGFLTILYQDQLGGLQIRDKALRWIDAPPREDSFIINIGDMLQHWTRGIYRATLHRVRNTGQRDRLSLPFFFDPNWTSNLVPIDEQLLRTSDLARVTTDRSEERWDGINLRALAAELTYGDFVWDKIRNVFPNLGNVKN
jgi:isopenicillin N synthase-like dioxygenase